MRIDRRLALPFLSVSSVAVAICGVMLSGVRPVAAQSGSCAAGCWEESPAMAPTPMNDGAGTIVGQKGYYAAGETTEGHQRTLFIFDSVTKSWSRGPDMPDAYPLVEDLTSAVVGNVIYFFGGLSTGFIGDVSKAAAFDTTTQRWSMRADMPTARGAALALAVGRQIYVIGGFNAAAETIATVEIYDTASNTWSAGPALPTPRSHMMGAVVGGNAFVFGGRIRVSGLPNNENLNVAEKLSGGVWSAISDLPTGRRTGNAVVVDGRIVVLGGERRPDGSTFNEVEEYDPATGRWAKLTPMPTGRHGSVAGRIGDSVYVLLGGLKGGTAFSASSSVFRYK